MSTNTTRLGLIKPDFVDVVDISELNTNADDIDAAVGAAVVTSTTRPGAPWSGQIIYETDTDKALVWDGTAWELAGRQPIQDLTNVTITTPTAGQKLVFDGTNWVNLTGYVYVSTVYYTSSGTFTKATYPWLRAVRVKVQAGGGGGAGSGANNHAGGAGGGGAYAEAFITDIAGLSSSVTVTRGAGGPGGAGGNNNGSGGGQSVFGPITADGGGSGGAPSNGGGSGAGSTTTANADIVFGGTGGGNGSNSPAGISTINGPAGGASYLGGGGRGAGSLTGTSNNGSSGNVYGGGGGGAFRQTTDSAGGAGANGLVIVELYA